MFILLTALHIKNSHKLPILCERIIITCCLLIMIVHTGHVKSNSSRHKECKFTKFTSLPLSLEGKQDNKDSLPFISLPPSSIPDIHSVLIDSKGTNEDEYAFNTCSLIQMWCICSYSKHKTHAGES